MTTKVPLHAVLTVGGYVALLVMVFTKPHPAALLLPLVLFGCSWFVQKVESG